MENNNRVPGTGALTAANSSGYGEYYIEGIKAAGKKLEQLGKNVGAFQMEIGRRKAEAESKMKEVSADRLSQTSLNVLSADANIMKGSISGEGENAYNFGNLQDIERFRQDVTALNAKIDASEKTYKETMGDPEDGPDKLTYYGAEKRAQLTAAKGDLATEGYMFENLGGKGDDYYDASSSGGASIAKSDDYMNRAIVTRNANNPELYDITIPPAVEGGKPEIFQGKTYQEFLDLQRESVLPDYQAMPDLSGAQFVKENTIGPNKYETSNQAASAYIQELMAPRTKAAALRYAKKRTGSRELLQTTLSTESREKLIDKYGISAPEGFTKEQFEYFEEMMQEWHDQKNAAKATASGGGGRGNKSDILNTAPQIELGITTKATDEYGTEMFVLGGDGSVVSSMGPTVSNKSSAVIRLPDELDVAISLGYEDGEAQPARNVKVRKIGYDGASPFGIATFDIDGEEQSIRIPLPIAGGGESVGDLYAAILQQYKMTEAEYDDMVGRLTASYVSHNEAE